MQEEQKYENDRMEVEGDDSENSQDSMDDVQNPISHKILSENEISKICLKMMDLQMEKIMQTNST